MKPGERIPLHDHSDRNSGGRVDGGSIVAAVGGSGSLGGGSTTNITLGAAGELPWFNVLDYGALGDGATDDTAAFNDAIAALIAAGTGVLYIPASTAAYIISATLTTISVPCRIMGDGWTTGASGPISEINYTSTSTSLWVVTANGVEFRDFGMLQTGGTATAGAAIETTGGILAAFEHLLISAFFTGVDLDNGLIWAMRYCYIEDVRKYGIQIANTTDADFGDWVIEACTFSSQVPSDAAIRIDSSGGGRIINNKLIGSATAGSNRFSYGIDMDIGTGEVTSILLVADNSIEGVAADAIRLVVGGSGGFAYVVISGNQVALRGNNTGRAVSLSGAGLHEVIISNNQWVTNGTARAAVSVTNSTNVRVGPNMLTIFNAEYTNSGGTVIDATGAIGGGVAISGAAASGSVPVGSSATAAAWQTLSAAGIAPNTVDYLVGTASAGLTSEIAVGTTPGGELGGTWASPTVDATHSGSAHADFIAKAIVDAKGDVIAATAADTVARVAVGSDGQVLTARSSASAGVAWEAPAASTFDQHVHVVDEQFSGDAVTTVFSLANEAAPDSVMAWVSGVRTPVTLGGAMNDQITFGAAPASATDNISVDYAAVLS